jgi:hypothetical protein
MDPLITAAMRALAAGDPLGAFSFAVSFADIRAARRRNRLCVFRGGPRRVKLVAAAEGRA